MDSRKNLITEKIIRYWTGLLREVRSHCPCRCSGNDWNLALDTKLVFGCKLESMISGLFQPSGFFGLKVAGL